MKSAPPLPRNTLLYVALFFLAVALIGCGGGVSSQPPPGGGPPPPPPFQPRAFPQDYFMRLPTQDGTQFVPDAAYDPSIKEVFVSNPDVNEVEAYSTVDGHYMGAIPVPGPAGLSFSPDFSQLVIGTITPYIYFADPSALHVTAQLAIPPSELTTDATGDTLMPVMPYPMADSTILLGMGGTAESSSSASMFVDHLVRYDPTTQAFTSEDPGPSGLFGTPARSGDGRFLICTSINNSATALFLYSASAKAYVFISSAALQNAGTLLAANADGSQFVSLQQSPLGGNSASQIEFWSSNLTAENSYGISSGVSSAPVYSRDGKYLYATTQNVLYALNAQTAVPAGYLGISVGGLLTTLQLCDVDENYHILGVTSPGGAAIINASRLQATIPTNLPLFVGSPSTEANPNSGVAAGGTQVQFMSAPNGPGSGDGIASSMEAYFGSTPATQDVVGPSPSSSNGANLLTATAPPAVSPGPVAVVLTDANNNPVYLPDAYTYGLRVLRVSPNTVSITGGDLITIFAYGLGFDLNGTSVTIGGAAVDMKKATLNSYASNSYPEQAITVPVPPGTPGWADVVVTTSSGTDTLKRGVQYLQAEVNLSGGPSSFAVYDSVRNLFYLTGGGNVVAVFDPQSQAMEQPLQSPTVSSGAILQSEALTPDSNTLLVSDPADATVVIFDLQAGTSKAVKVLLPQDPSVTLTAPMSVVATAGNRAFVSLSPCIPDPVREINLASLTVQTRPDAASACAPYVPYPEMGGSSSDGSTVIFAGNNELEPPGPEYIWSYHAASDTFQGPTVVADSPWRAGNGAANSDGSVIALGQGVLDQRLMPLVPIIQFGMDDRLNETGSLIYGTNGAIGLSDTHNGRLLLTLNVPNTDDIGPSRPLAIDATGQQVLVGTQAGLSYFKLSVVPLAVGTVTPSSGGAGTTIQLKGSGFVGSTAVKIGGQSAACNSIDAETISCTVPNLPPGETSIALTNPDGQAYSFENAFLVQ